MTPEQVMNDSPATERILLAYISRTLPECDVKTMLDQIRPHRAEGEHTVTEKEDSRRDTMDKSGRGEQVMICPHPPSALYTWIAADGTRVVCCKACHAVLHGAA